MRNLPLIATRISADGILTFAQKWAKAISLITNDDFYWNSSKNAVEITGALTNAQQRIKDKKDSVVGFHFRETGYKSWKLNTRTNSFRLQESGAGFLDFHETRLSLPEKRVS